MQRVLGLHVLVLRVRGSKHSKKKSLYVSVQVYKSEGPGHSYRWNKRTCGVVCFVKDNLKRSYYIRVYDMDKNTLEFDQEIYNQFK